MSMEVKVRIVSFKEIYRDCRDWVKTSNSPTIMPFSDIELKAIALAKECCKGTEIPNGSFTGMDSWYSNKLDPRLIWALGGTTKIVIEPYSTDLLAIIPNQRWGDFCKNIFIMEQAAKIINDHEYMAHEILPNNPLIKDILNNVTSAEELNYLGTHWGKLAKAIRVGELTNKNRRTVL